MKYKCQNSFKPNSQNMIKVSNKTLGKGINLVQS